MPHGALDLVLAVGTMLAGVGVVQLSVSSLQSYVTVPFPTAQPGGTDPPSPVVGEIRQIMKDVEEGGWMEARSALRALESLGAAHGLPPLRQAKHTTEG